MKTLECRGITLNDTDAKICVPIMGKNIAEIEEQAKIIRNIKPDIVEWRADFFEVSEKNCKDNNECQITCGKNSDFQKVDRNLAYEKCLLKLHKILKDIPIIFTFRTAREGGEKNVSYNEYEEMCRFVAGISEKYNVAMIDVELYENRNNKGIGELIVDIKKSGAKVIGSNHHFEGTPTEKHIYNVLKIMQYNGADVCKIAVMPKDKKDVTALINASSKANKEIKAPIITMSMGELGAVTRVCTKKTGSVLTFAAGINASAPGQLPYETVRYLLKNIEEKRINYNIALIGFMGTGKTTISRALSMIMNLKEVDVDQYIVKKEGKSIKDIFAENGEEYFRNLETEALRELQNEKGIIISCGGGAVLRHENVEILKQGSVIVQLTATPETIYERVKDHTHRPILNNDMSVRHISELMEQREPRYNSAADIIVSVDKGDRVDTCYNILKALDDNIEENL